ILARRSLVCVVVCFSTLCTFFFLPCIMCLFFFFFQAEDGIRDFHVTGVQTCALPICFSHFTTSNHAYREALTMTQGAVVVSQLFNGLAVRTEEESLFRVGLFSNRALVAAEVLGVGIFAAISYTSLLQGVFHTAPLTIYDWLMLAGF